MLDLDILIPRLEQLHIIPPEQGRERNIQLRIGQVHSHAGPGAFTERHELFLHQLRVLSLQPAVRVEGFGIDEDGGIIVHVHGVHGNGGVGRDDPVLVPERGGRGDARHAADDAVGHAEALLDDGGEVREGFEIAPERDGVFVRDGVGELGLEGFEDARGAEQVVGDDGKGVARCLVTGDDEQDALVREAVEALLVGGHFLVVRHLVEDGRDGLGFGSDLHVRICRLVDLFLDHLFRRVSSVR